MGGVLRIFFTPEDLLLVQLAKHPDPMWEAVLGPHVLATPTGLLAPRLRLWKAEARKRMDPELRSACRLLTDLAPATASYFPDFLTPIDAMEGLDAGLDALRSTPRSRVARELAFAARRRELPNWMNRMGAGDDAAMKDIADAFQAIYDRLIRPDWTRVEATVELDRSQRLSALERSLGALLESMVPFSWDYPVLSARYPMDWDIHLRGRGVTFIPSYFCDRTPVAIVDPNLPPVVVYPVQDPTTTEPHEEALAALLGGNRAKILIALRAARTTSAIAAVTELRDSVVSGHLKILRNAGLVDSERQGHHVVHTLTARGVLLVSQVEPR